MLLPLCAYLVQYCAESRAPKVASSVQACQITGTEPRHPKQTLLPLLPLNIKESFVDLIAQTRTNKGVVLARLQHRGVITQVAEPCVLRDRKSTRLNSSQRCISFAVFLLIKQY